MSWDDWTARVTTHISAADAFRVKWLSFLGAAILLTGWRGGYFHLHLTFRASTWMRFPNWLNYFLSVCKSKHEYPSALFQNDTIAATLIGAASVILFATSTVLMKNGHLVQWRKCSPPFVPTNFAEIGISGITLGRSNDAQFLDLHAAFIKACYCWVLRELFTEETQKECVSIVVETIWSSRCLKTWTMKLLTHFSSH